MKRSIALLLAVLTLTGTLTLPALAAGPDGEEGAAQGAAQEETSAQEGGAGQETSQPEPDPDGTVSWANLDSRIREGSLSALILSESITSLENLDYDQMYENLRKQINSIATAQWYITMMGGDSSSLDQAYDSLRDTFEDLKDGVTQEDNADLIWQLEDTVNQVVTGGETVYLTLLDLEQQAEDVHAGMGALINSINAAPEEAATVRTANAIWPAKGEKILPEFAQTVRRDYRAGLTQLDYAKRPESARKTINNWVEDQTAGKITDIIPGGALGKDTKMVLTNAVYFKAGWQEEFKAENTEERPFWTTPEESVNVQMMNRRSKELNYAKLDGAQMIEMPYKDGRFSMLVLLPDENSSLEALEAGMNAASVAEWSAGMRPAEVEIFMPKFKQESSYDLSTTLAALGMGSAFDAGTADFSGITGNRDMAISGVLHKTFVEVSEEGTEAAAATAVIVMRASLAPQERVIFNADRPFVYIIRDNATGAALFIGRYAHP